jgi:hypothetical protein
VVNKNKKKNKKKIKKKERKRNFLWRADIELSDNKEFENYLYFLSETMSNMKSRNIG